MDEGPARHVDRGAGEIEARLPREGVVTAGNSSQTSDGASAVVVMSGERMRALGLTPLGRFVGFATAGVEPSGSGSGRFLPSTRC